MAAARRPYGAAQEQINITDAVNFLIPTPPREEQTRIADNLDDETQRLDRVIDLVGQQIDKLREYRRALITAAVTGKIDLCGEGRYDPPPDPATPLLETPEQPS